MLMPPGFSQVTPYIFAKDAVALIDFLVAGFGLLLRVLKLGGRFLQPGLELACAFGELRFFFLQVVQLLLEGTRGLLVLVEGLLELLADVV